MVARVITHVIPSHPIHYHPALPLRYVTKRRYKSPGRELPQPPFLFTRRRARPVSFIFKAETLTGSGVVTQVSFFPTRDYGAPASSLPDLRDAIRSLYEASTKSGFVLNSIWYSAPRPCWLERCQDRRIYPRLLGRYVNSSGMTASSFPVARASATDPCAAPPDVIAGSIRHLSA